MGDTLSPLELRNMNVQPDTPMPPNVAKAVVDVMGEIKLIQKDAKNDHGKYQFAGIDAFLEACRPLCASAGLVIVQDEEHFEVLDGKWLMIRFAFTLAHASGETWDRRIRRTILVQAAMGSQAFGAAQSYAEKQFMRSLFQIATGENEDVDTHKAELLPNAKANLGPAPLGDDFPGASGKGKSSHQAKKDGTDVRFNELKDEISHLDSNVAVGVWVKERTAEIQTMPESWRKVLREELDEQKRLILAQDEKDDA